MKWLTKMEKARKVMGQETEEAAEKVAEQLSPKDEKLAAKKAIADKE